MLKNILQDMANGVSNKFCKFGDIYMALDEETQEALSGAMKSDASTMSLCKVLKDEGHPIGREHLGAKRECFKNPTDSCCIKQHIKGGTK
jgi:hypothetical protein